MIQPDPALRPNEKSLSRRRSSMFAHCIVSILPLPSRGRGSRPPPATRRRRISMRGGPFGEDGEAHRAARVVVDNHGQPPTERPALWQFDSGGFPCSVILPPVLLSPSSTAHAVGRYGPSGRPRNPGTSTASPISGLVRRNGVFRSVERPRHRGFARRQRGEQVGQVIDLQSPVDDVHQLSPGLGGMDHVGP